MLSEHGTVSLYRPLGVVWQNTFAPTVTKYIEKRGGASHGVFLFYPK